MIFPRDKGGGDTEITTIRRLLPGGGAGGRGGIPFPIFNLQEPCKRLMEGAAAIQGAGFIKPDLPFMPPKKNNLVTEHELWAGSWHLPTPISRPVLGRGGWGLSEGGGWEHTPGVLWGSLF